MPHRLPAPFFTARYAYPTTLLCAFCFVWLALAIAPSYRQDWLLENVVVFAAVPLFVATITRLRFSNMAYTLLFVFLCAHEIGAHYTYSLVPYDEGFRHLTGRSLDALLGEKRIPPHGYLPAALLVDWLLDDPLRQSQLPVLFRELHATGAADLRTLLTRHLGMSMGELERLWRGWLESRFA